MSILRAKRAPEDVAPGGLSIIAVGMSLKGDIESNGTVKVEGTVMGHIRARNQVLVAKGGLVEGDIDAREAVIGGAVHGGIRAVERIEIQSGAAVKGDITTQRISVSEGGTLNGQLRMGESAAVSPRGTTPSPGVEARQPSGLAHASPAVSAVRTAAPAGRMAGSPESPNAGLNE